MRRHFTVARAYILRCGLYVPGLDLEDLVSIFVTAGWLECRKRRKASWRLFCLAGKRQVVDAIRAAHRLKRRAPTVSLIDIHADPQSAFAHAEARLTVGTLVERARLTPRQKAALEAFLSGRKHMWSDGNGRTHGNAMLKALTKLREAAEETRDIEGREALKHSPLPDEVDDQAANSLCVNVVLKGLGIDLSRLEASNA